MFYVLDENNNKVEAYDKQGVLALLEQAIADGDLESIASDSAFVDKLKCCVGTGTHHIAFIPQATYNELQENGQLLADAYYFITDDTTAYDLNAQLEALTEAVNALQVDRTTCTYSSNINGVFANSIVKNNNNCVLNFKAGNCSVPPLSTLTITIPAGFEISQAAPIPFAMVMYSSSCVYAAMEITTNTISLENTSETERITAIDLYFEYSIV